MSFNKLLCIVITFVAINVQAQDLKILVNNNGKVGFADSDGNEVIKCQYESAQPFANGCAIVTKSGKYGIINATGKVLLPLKYTQVQKWNGELFIVKNGKKIGLANHQGQLVLPVKYSHISKPNCFGRALIAIGGKPASIDKKSYMANAKYGIIDDLGNVIVTAKYKGLYEFSLNATNTYPFYEGKRLEHSYHYTTDTLITDCRYLGYSNNAYGVYHAGILDATGQEVLKSGQYYYVMQPKNNMTRYYVSKSTQTICGYYDLNTSKGFQVAKFNKALNDIQFWSHGDFTEAIAPVNGEHWSFIDKTGKVLREGYTSLKHSEHTALWAAKNKAGKWEVFDETNNDIAPLFGFDDIKFPTNKEDKKIFAVLKEDKYGGIDTKGNIIIPFEYDNMLANSFDFIPVKKNEKWGLVSTENISLIPTKYLDIKLPSEYNAKHFWVMTSDSLFYNFDLTTKKIAPKGYSYVTNFANGIAYVTPSNIQAKLQDNYPGSSLLQAGTSMPSYGYLINTNDELLMELPIAWNYKDAAIVEIEKYGSRPLTKMESKNIILEITKKSRSYDLKSVISESEWNY